MKKRILTLVVMLVLVSVLAVPGVVIANGSTAVTGDVAEGYTFTAPSTVALGSMAPSATLYKANSTDGRLDGNNSAGYLVTGRDEKPGYTGYMVIGDNMLMAELDISKEDANYTGAHMPVEFLNTDGITGADISLYVRQFISCADPVATGYSITITFTVGPKA